MILSQAFLYSDKRKSRLEHHHRRRSRNKLNGFEDEEEEAALLRDDDDDDNDEGEGTERGGRSRDSSQYRGSRSISSRGKRLSMSRSRSTELVGTRGSLSRAERGILQDESFDFNHHQRPKLGGGDRSRTPSGSSVITTSSNGSRNSTVIKDTIHEAGESSVTVRE